MRAEDVQKASPKRSRYSSIKPASIPLHPPVHGEAELTPMDFRRDAKDRFSIPIARSTLAGYSRRMDHGQKLSATLLPDTGPKAGRQFPEFRVNSGTGRQENGLLKAK